MSSTDAWAVGNARNPTTGAAVTVTLRWDGSGWTRVASPNPAGRTTSSDSNFLDGVSALSATDAWAVGDYTSNGVASARTSLIVHWNGTSWTRVASPSPGGNPLGTILDGVSVTSATQAWAVGEYSVPTQSTDDSLVLHWNGTSWSKV